MNPTLVVGIDPGLVHTGVVQLLFVPKVRKIKVSTEAVLSPPQGSTGATAAELVRAWVLAQADGFATLPRHIYIEGYRPRSAFNSDARMTALVQEIRRLLPSSTVLMNTGVKKVVKRPLMEVLGVWKFSTVTHHQDLRSAARIALLGMLKQETMNRLLTDIVLDHLDGRPWDVQHR
jgi:hypothetical protein